MREECVKIQREVIALGADQATMNMAVRRHTRDCPLCLEFIQSLIQLEETERTLEQDKSPRDMAEGTLAIVLKEAKGRLGQGGSKRSKRGVLWGWATNFLNAFRGQR
jgi:hypothetical protein